MEEHSNDGTPTTGKTDQRPSIDPLRRVWVPIEKRDAHGDFTFRTSDGEKYYRDEQGVIRHATVRQNGKMARKLRSLKRKAGR